MYKTRAWRPTTVYEDRLFIVNNWHLIDSNFEVVADRHFAKYKDVTISDKRYNICITLHYGYDYVDRHIVPHIDERISARNHNRARFDYKIIGEFGYRIPKDTTILWRYCLAASYKRAFIAAYKAISAAVLPEVSNIIIRATLHCIIGDLSGYVEIAL